MTTPLVSCVIPVYNGERYVGEAIESVLAQAHRPLEIIVVDDGSADGSAAVAAAFGEPVRVISLPHAGPAATRNAGIAAARGSLFALLDADDLWLPNKLALQLERLAAQPTLDFVVTMVQNFWAPEFAAEGARHASGKFATPAPGYGGSSVLIRRAAWERVGPLRVLAAAEMVDWFTRAREVLVGDLLPEVLVRRRVHGTNISRVRPDNAREGALAVFKELLDRRRPPGRPGSAVPPT